MFWGSSSISYQLVACCKGGALMTDVSMMMQQMKKCRCRCRCRFRCRCRQAQTQTQMQTQTSDSYSGTRLESGPGYCGVRKATCAKAGQRQETLTDDTDETSRESRRDENREGDGEGNGRDQMVNTNSDPALEHQDSHQHISISISIQGREFWCVF